MGAAPGRPPLSDAERLLWLVRRLPAGEFAGTLRRGLADPDLMGIIAALPGQRRHALTNRARPPGEPAPEARAAAARRADRPVASAIRTARQQAQISQRQLARLVGVRQAAGSQWEWGATEPSGLHLACLLRVLPGLADWLEARTTAAARGQPVTTRAS